MGILGEGNARMPANLAAGSPLAALVPWTVPWDSATAAWDILKDSVPAPWDPAVKPATNPAPSGVAALQPKAFPAMSAAQKQASPVQPKPGLPTMEQLQKAMLDNVWDAATTMYKANQILDRMN